MDLFPENKSAKRIQKEKLLPHEQVLCFAVERMQCGYKAGWLYYRCRDHDLLEIYEDYKHKGILSLLEAGTTERSESPKLTIELVPKTCWFSNVRSNVSRSEWDRLRKASAAQAQYKCEVCGGQGQRWPVECHEIWDYDDDSARQTLTGLISLCPACHEVKHMGFTELKGKRIPATAHLSIVNRWSYQQAEEYVARAFQVWRMRSKQGWTLDISWLSQFGIAIEQLDRESMVG